MATLTAKYKPYPAYKPSGIEWLGEIPVHWEVRRLKHIADIRYGLGQPPKESRIGLPLIRATNVNRGRITNADMLHVDPADVPAGRRAFLSTGEIIVVRSGAYTADSAIIPKKYDGAVAGYDMVVTVREAKPEFIAISLLCPYLRDAQLVVTSARSAQPHLNAEELGDALILLPPIVQQQSIAAFLNRATAKIDALVSKKERLIELLREKRTALISHAVTKGLDPDAPKKDSDTEWLGQIPAHWEVKRLKYLADFINGAAFNPAEWGTQGTPIIRIQNLNGGDDFNYTTRKLPAKYISQEGELLFGWSGNRGTSFGPFLWSRKGKYYVNQHIFRVLPRHVTKEWFYWTLKAVTFRVERQAHGIIGMVHITRDELGAIYIPTIPNMSEQQAIAEFLDRETAKLDDLLVKVREAIARLKEFRIALISAAVTGRIDVREGAE